jgi:hypothetical protein
MSISSFEIDTNLMPSVETIRQIVVNGTIGSKFTIVVLKDDSIKFYDWTTDTFTDGHAPKNNLHVTMSTRSHRSNVVFPSGSGKYVLKLFASGDTTTTKGVKVLSNTVEKTAGTTTLTFTPETTNTANYSTFPTSTSTGEIDDGSTVSVAWNIDNASTDAGGFGFALKEEYIDGGFNIGGKYWYVKVQEAIVSNPAGSGEDSNQVSVADLTGLAVGMNLYYHKGTTTPRIKAGTVYDERAIIISAIDEGTKTITFNEVVAFENSETMTFRGYTTSVIQASSGAIINFNTGTVNAIKPEAGLYYITKTVRSDVSNSTTITLNDTYGIGGGNINGYKGLGVDNSSSNLVTSVTPDCPDPSDGSLDNDGSIVVQKTQNLEQGTQLSFLNTYKQVTMQTVNTVTRHPDSNTTIYFDLDKFLTVGTQS